MRAVATRIVSMLVLLVVPVCAAHALETDQYYAWTRTIEDASEAINAKLTLEMDAAVDEANSRRRRVSCHGVSEILQRRLRFFIFQPIQLWVDHAPFVDRVPLGAEEELDYRRESIYPFRGLVDLGVSIPPSPTIEVNGVRLGTDKLAHFFSNGWRYYARYRKHVRRGMPPAEAERRAIETGVLMEKTLLGFYLSGVFSIADMEANHRGFEFFRDLCAGEQPAFIEREGKWRRVRGFDIRGHVTPEWDESWRTPVYTRFRWRRVAARLERRCAEREHPLVVARREEYAARDVETPTDRLVERLVAEGRIGSPDRFTIEAACDAPANGE